MKTKILSLVLMFVVISGLTKSTYAATNNAGYIVLNNIKSINKIEVHGNVELFISDNSTEQVKVYNKYYSESALVQSKNGVLRISSYNAEKLVVWVDANDLRSVSAFDDAEINTFGKFSAIDFSIDLHDNATAKLNLDAYNASVTLKDSAKIDLSGSSEQFNINRSFASIFTDNNFSTRNANDQMIIAPIVNRNVDLAGLE